MIALDLVKQFGQRMQIDEYSVYREYVQVVFLNTLYSDARAKQLFFKGGTALRLMYSSVRFSEDLDFNAHFQQKEVEALFAEIVSKMHLEVPGIEIKDMESLVGYSAKLFVPVPITKLKLTVKLDVSFREKVETWVDMPLQSSLPVQGYPLVRVFTKEEILAEKFCALMSRFKGRDVFDIWYLLHGGTVIDLDMVERKFKRIGVGYSPKLVLSRIQEFEDKKLANDLNKFLPVKERVLIGKLKELIQAKMV